MALKRIDHGPKWIEFPILLSNREVSNMHLPFSKHIEFYLKTLSWTTALQGRLKMKSGTLYFGEINFWFIPRLSTGIKFSRQGGLSIWVNTVNRNNWSMQERSIHSFTGMTDRTQEFFIFLSELRSIHNFFHLPGYI